jgi:26S proteasome regulatory subunit N9
LCSFGFILQYLAYVPASAVPIEERHALAVDVALSALVGEGVFNFGEIIEHPILASLEGTPDAWLRDLLAVFHTGDVDAFNLVVSSNQAAFQAQVRGELPIAVQCGALSRFVCVVLVSPR